MKLRFPLLFAALGAATLLAPAARLQAQAKAPVLPPGVEPFEVKEANKGKTVWYGRFGISNCGFIDMGDGVLVVDTGATAEDAKNLMAQIKEKTGGKRVKWIVLTHLHADSNTGLQAFLPTDATIFLNGKVASGVAAAITPKDTRTMQATVVGVFDRTTIVSGAHVVEVEVPSGAAHTDHDLVAYFPESEIAFVGDLVTPSRCPMASDPNSDPRGWLTTLDKLEKRKISVLIPTRGDSTEKIADEIGKTRRYLKRTIDVLVALKKRNAPESEVAAALKARSEGDYCPVELDTANGTKLYSRITADGKFPASVKLQPKAPVAKPQPAKK
jgi:glyoxylase-like metal-dependent hydrolase (beta-lactamase superfamily II)